MDFERFLRGKIRLMGGCEDAMQVLPAAIIFF